MSSQSFANLANSEFNGNIILKNGYIQFPDNSIQTTAGGGGGGNVSTTTINTYTNTSVNNFQAATITCATQPSGNNSTNVANTAFVQSSTASVGILANNNTGIGLGVLGQNSTGYNNCAFGVSSLASNTTGHSNTGIGFDTLNNSTTGINNTAIGLQTLQNLTTGNYNTGVGFQNLIYLTTGENNTTIGAQAGLYLTPNSFDNTLIGNQAGPEITDNTTYNFLTCIGSNSQPVNVGTDNQIVLGRLNGDDELFIPGNNIFLGNQNNINETYTIEASGSNSTIIFTAQDSVPIGYQNILTLSTTSNSVPTLSYLDNGTSIVNQTMLTTAFNNIIQVGKNITLAGGQPTTINFANPFPNGIIPVVTCQNSQGSTWVNIYLTVGNVTNTGFDVWESGTGSPQQIAMNYIAIGLP